MPTFTKISEQAAQGCLVKPLLINFFSGDSPFRVKMNLERSPDRPPDNWFHASTHPTMTARELYLYMAHPEAQQRELAGYVGKMSMMFGTIMHEVVRQALIQLKVVVPVPQGFCRACGLPQPRMCKEHGGIHEETRSRGHLDAILNFGDDGIRGFDLKTIRPLGLNKVPDMVLEFFIEHWPKHYYQFQEYMRLTGLRNFIVLYMSLGNPWEFREFHIPFDPAIGLEIETKYRAVLAAVERGTPIIA
jgi:hypothetical protein